MRATARRASAASAAVACLAVLALVPSSASAAACSPTTGLGADSSGRSIGIAYCKAGPAYIQVKVLCLRPAGGFPALAYGARVRSSARQGVSVGRCPSGYKAKRAEAIVG